MRLAPLLVLLAGCPLPDDYDTAKRAGEDDDDTPTRSDTDSPESDVDTDVDTDWEADADTEVDAEETGIAVPYWTASFAATADGEYRSGSFGIAFYGVRRGDWACVEVGRLEYEGESRVACPGCAWAWNLSAVVDSVQDGDLCDDWDWALESIDGYFDYDWAFAESWTYGHYPIEDAILLSDSVDWFTFAYNIPEGGIYQVYGDAESVSMYRPFGDGVYYYYYL